MVDRSKCTPPLSIRAMLCIKLVVKIHCNNRTLRGVHLPQMSSQNSFYYYSELLIFLLYGFSKHVHISVLSLSLFVGLCVAFFFCIFFQSCSRLTGHMWVFFKLVFNFMHFCFIGHGEKAIAKLVKRAIAKREQDSQRGMEMSDG